MQALANKALEAFAAAKFTGSEEQQFAVNNLIQFVAPVARNGMPANYIMSGQVLVHEANHVIYDEGGNEGSCVVARWVQGSVDYCKAIVTATGCGWARPDFYYPTLAQFTAAQPRSILRIRVTKFRSSCMGVRTSADVVVVPVHVAKLPGHVGPGGGWRRPTGLGEGHRMWMNSRCR